MKTRITALLVLLTLITALVSAPAALAESRYTASTPLQDASSGNIKNIQRAAASINGRRLEAGQSFSFNETVGPRTKAQGYVAAENARGVSVTGGGVAQVATTLYLALQRLGKQVEFTALSTYGNRFEDTYVSDGNMAVITDYSGGTDFAFVNRTGGVMTIEMWASNTALNCVVTVDEGSVATAKWFSDPAPTAVPTAQPARMVSAAESTFFLPISFVVWITCRCRLDRSTTSASTIPIVPTPAAARYSAAGAPRPPAPIISTFALRSFFCPLTPISFRMICLE